MSYQEEYDDRRRMEFLHSNKQGLSLEFWPKKHGASEDRTTHFKWFVVRRDEAGVLCDFAPCHGAPLPFSQEARLIIDIYRIKGVSGATPVALGDPAKDVSATMEYQKASSRIRTTGEDRTSSRLADEDDGPCTAGGIKYEIVEKLQKEMRREQRRYEIARDMLPALILDPKFNSDHMPGVVLCAVDWADALLAELDKPRAEAPRVEAVKERRRGDKGPFIVGDIVSSEPGSPGALRWKIAAVRSDGFYDVFAADGTYGYDKQNMGHCVLDTPSTE